jgi:hypothetical protein
MGATVAGIVLGIVVTATGAIVGFLIGGPIGAGILGAISLGFAIPFGLAVAEGKPYQGALGVWRCFLDATWSCLNTWAGAIYYGVHRIFGNTHEAARSAGTGSIWLTKGVSPAYATTIGTVKAGSSPSIDRHEEIHILQARLFGPLYLPLVGLNYVIATIIPYWLLFRDKNRYPISGFGTYFLHGVYPHVWNELWAYRVADGH